MQTLLDTRYHAVSLPAQPLLADLPDLVGPYCAIILTQLRAILDRTERSEHYPWIDTKIDLITGEELPGDDPLFGRDLVSGWVQGRGLEAMTRFAEWLAPWSADARVEQLEERARRLVADLLVRLRQTRALNGGHLHFFMTAEGKAFDFGSDEERVPLALDACSPHGYSDLFCAKAMYAASHLLGDTDAQHEARDFCMAVHHDIVTRAFRSDQPQPATGARAWVTGAHSHGPAMISLGMAALFAQFEPCPASVELGLSLVRRVLDAHVNLGGRWAGLAEYDLVEFIDHAGQPFSDELGRVVSDPGHSLELVGLFLKFSRAVERCGGATPAQREEIRRLERLMPALLDRAFQNGYQPALGGICKTLDLLTRQHADPTMPWWSLPETIRAALASWHVAESAEIRARCLEILALSHNAFVTLYLRPEIHLMSIKVRDGSGCVIDMMTSVPDADPGYHTALSLIDALDTIERLTPRASS